MEARLAGFAWSAGSLPDAEFSPRSNHGSSRTVTVWSRVAITSRVSTRTGRAGSVRRTGGARDSAPYGSGPGALWSGGRRSPIRASPSHGAYVRRRERPTNPHYGVSSPCRATMPRPDRDNWRRSAVPSAAPLCGSQRLRLPAADRVSGSSRKRSQCAGRTTPKCRRSSVASFVSPSDSHIAITAASTKPSSRSTYWCAKSTARSRSRAPSSATRYAPAFMSSTKARQTSGCIRLQIQ